jgi:hypothetical protein
VRLRHQEEDNHDIDNGYDDDIVAQHPFVHRGRLTSIRVPEQDVKYSSFVSPEWARLTPKHRSEYGIKDSLRPLPGHHDPHHHQLSPEAIRHNMALLRSYLYKRRIRHGRGQPLESDGPRPHSPESDSSSRHC